VSLFESILSRIETRINYLDKKMEKEEKLWCIDHLGKRLTERMIINSSEAKVKRKGNGSKFYSDQKKILYGIGQEL
jgi:hypothetical protein